jgi:MarR family transcriptional regulator, transcriptional regulator for hemolysin
MPLKTNPDSLGFMMTETARLLRVAFERRIAEAGLDITPAEARTLVYVAAGEGSRQNIIAERMGVEPMTVCAYLDRLEKLNLIARCADPNDRRAKNVRTTDEADAMLANVRDQTSDLFDQAQTGMDPEARVVFMESLKTMRDNLRSVLSDKPVERAIEEVAV